MQNDTACINEWVTLVGLFNELIKGSPTAEAIKTELLELKETARLSAVLTYRQTDAIMARVNNYLNGEYGNTKKAENLQPPKQ